jgi:PAS domain S-box-containing protein
MNSASTHQVPGASIDQRFTGRDMLRMETERAAIHLNQHLTRCYDALHELQHLSSLLFDTPPAPQSALDDWFEREGFGIDTDGFWQPLPLLQAFREDAAPLDAISYSWPAAERANAPACQRMYSLRKIGPILQAIRDRLPGTAWIYYQDVTNTALQYPYIDQITAITPDFQWATYHTYQSVTPEANPQRSIQWTNPTIDYAGEGLIVSVSIPVYIDDTFTGLWSIDLPMENLYTHMRFEETASGQITMIINRRGEIVAHPQVHTEIDKDKGSIYQAHISTLGPAYQTLDVDAMLAQGRGELKLNGTTDGSYYGCFEHVPDLEWLVISIVPEAHLLSSITSQYEQFLTIISNFPEVMYVVDPDTYEVLFVTNVFKEMLGYDPVGMTCYEAFQGFKQQCDFCTNDIILNNGGKPYSWEYHNPLVDRTFHITDQIMPWPDGRQVRFEIATDITDHKRMADAVQQSEARYRLLADHILDVIWQMDMELRFTYVNPAVEQVLGYTVDEFVGHFLYEFCDESDFAQMVSVIQSTVASGGEQTSVIFLSQMRHKDGRRLIVEIHGTLILNDDGTPRHLQGLTRDVTAQQQAEQVLRRYERITACTGDLMSYIDRDYAYRAVNDTYLTFWQQEREAIVGRTVADLIGLEAFEKVLRPMLDRCLAGETIRYQDWFDYPQGGKRFMDVGYYPAPAANGEVEGIVVSARDITHQYENELSFQSTLQSSIDGFWISDAAGQIFDFNDALCTMLGYSREEIAAMHPADFEAAESEAERIAHLQAIMEAGHDRFETRHRRKDGSLIDVEISAQYEDIQGGRFFVFARDITNRKRAENELRHSQYMLRLILDNIPQSVFWKDRDLRYLGCNAAFAQDAGLDSHKAIVGLDDYALPWQPEAELYRADDQAVMDSGQPRLNYEEPQTTPTGRYIWLKTSKVPIRNEQDEVIAVLGMYEDITERKRSENLLRLQRDLVAQLGVTNAMAPALDAIMTTVLQVDEIDSGGIYLLDKASGALDLKVHHGLSDEFVTSSRYFPASAPQTRLIMAGDPIYTHYEKLLVNTKPEERQQEGLRAIALIPIHYEDLIIGAFNLASHTQDEMSSATRQALETIAAHIGNFIVRIQAQEDLRRSEQLVRRVIDATPGWVFVKDQNFRYILVNKGLINDIGLTEDLMLGKDDIEVGFRHELVFGNPERGITGSRVIEKQVFETSEVIHTPNDPVINVEGKRMIFDAHRIPLHDEAGNVWAVLGFAHDITQLTESKAALEQYTYELEVANEELQQFAYVASHDLQEPLRMVTSFLQLLQQRYQDQLDDKADQYIHFAVDGASRMKTLINDLLTYSRVTTQGKAPAPTPLTRVVEAVLHDLQLLINETQVTITYDPLPHVQADESQMAQLLQNLLSNAIKFRGDTDPQVHIGVRQNGEEWLFSVADNGIGIAPEYFEQIFVIFQRLHTRDCYEGTGIGLAVCKRIVERHKGRIWVESTPGQGTTFYFTLPVSTQEA